MTPAPVAATREAFRLAEGPRWDAARGRLLWVDILAGAVLEGRLDDGQVTVAARSDFGGMVGAVAFADDGSLLVAAQDRLVALGADGTRRNGPRVVAAGERRRLNDGAPDPAGRFVVGTMSLEGESQREVLARLETDGSLTPIDDDLGLSNGLAWSADGRRMYSADSGRGVVFVRDYDPADGAAGERRVHLRFDEGVPDGIAMDAEDHLWVAVHGRGEVRRFAPDGALVDRVDVPAPHSTAVAFAGDDLRTLVVTTAYGELGEQERRAHPDSGRLFTTRVDVPGLPVPPWSGAAF
jgi:sugar lactone lactonase YvrE